MTVACTRVPARDRWATFIALCSLFDRQIREGPRLLFPEFGSGARHKEPRAKTGLRVEVTFLYRGQPAPPQQAGEYKSIVYSRSGVWARVLVGKRYSSILEVPYGLSWNLLWATFRGPWPIGLLKSACGLFFCIAISAHLWHTAVNG